jgi:hypothetical protein
MARTKITTTSDDLIDDSGNILWSTIQGEQLEFPVTLSFIELLTDNYTLEAVVIEALNDGSGIRPTTIEPSGVQNTLNIRRPVNRGTWAAGTADYVVNDYVLHNGLYYILESVDSVGVAPDTDTAWSEYALNTVYIQFTSDLSLTYTIQPSVDKPVYGFFELSVQEPATAGLLQRVWKPARGLVEFLFSPTHLVP